MSKIIKGKVNNITIFNPSEGNDFGKLDKTLNKVLSVFLVSYKLECQSKAKIHRQRCYNM
jgi:hypothetical protein